MMQINLHNYCSFTQWMSSELTAINPETFGSQLTIFFCQKLSMFWVTLAIIRRLCSRLK